jgi:hypothetical protein
MYLLSFCLYRIERRLPSGQVTDQEPKDCLADPESSHLSTAAGRAGCCNTGCKKATGLIYSHSATLLDYLQKLLLSTHTPSVAVYISPNRILVIQRSPRRLVNNSKKKKKKKKKVKLSAP